MPVPWWRLLVRLEVVLHRRGAAIAMAADNECPVMPNAADLEDANSALHAATPGHGAPISYRLAALHAVPALAAIGNHAR